MQIGEYYFSKVQTITLAALILGLLAGLTLVQREQTIQTRAAIVSNILAVEPAECQGESCTTKSLSLVIKAKGLENRPTAPIEAKVTLPAQKIKPKIGPSVAYYIPFRDASVRVTDPESAKRQLLNEWPRAKIENWDNIVSQSVANGWNPAFVLTLWWEESGGQGHPAYGDGLGCAPTNPGTTDINISLSCLFRNFDRFSADKFDDFMCVYGGDINKPPCTFNVVNVPFPGNVAKIYSRLVPAGPGAIVR